MEGDGAFGTLAIAYARRYGKAARKRLKLYEQGKPYREDNPD